MLLLDSCRVQIGACVLDDCIGKLGVSNINTYFTNTFSSMSAADAYNNLETLLSRLMIYHLIHAMNIKSYPIALALAVRVRAL